MIKMNPRIEITGKLFYPSKVISEIGINFEKHHDVGIIGEKGRYLGQPIPYGSATISPPKNIEEWAQIMWLLNLLDDKVNVIRKFGGLDISLKVAYYYNGQFNTEMGVEEISSMARLNIPFLFSVYQMEDLTEIS